MVMKLYATLSFMLNYFTVSTFIKVASWRRDDVFLLFLNSDIFEVKTFEALYAFLRWVKLLNWRQDMWPDRKLVRLRESRPPTRLMRGSIVV